MHLPPVAQRYHYHMYPIIPHVLINIWRETSPKCWETNNLNIRPLFFSPYASGENRAGGETRADEKVKKIKA